MADDGGSAAAAGSGRDGGGAAASQSASSGSRRERELAEQNAHLTEYAQRLETELRAYQQRDAPPLDAAEVEDAATTEAVPPWVASPDAMSPLLVAYDARIAELEAANRRHVDAMVAQRSTAEAMARENEQLHAELKETTDKLIRQSSEGSGAGFTFGGSVATSEAMAELQERLDATLKECNILQEQVTTLMEDADVLRANVTERDGRIVQFTQRFSAANAAVQRLQEENRRLRGDLQTCEAKVRDQSSSVSSSSEKYNAVASELKREAAAKRSLEAQVDEYKRALREVTQHADAEAEGLAESARAATSRSRELKVMVDAQGRELEGAKESARTARRELDTVKKDCEGMLKVMQSLEKQVNEYAARESRWETMEKTAGERVEEALLERDQAEARETQSRREIARLLERRRVEGAEAQRQQAEAVDAVRARMQAQVAGRDDELSALGIRCTELAALADHSARDRKTAEREVERIVAAATEEQGKLHGLVESLTERLRDAESARDEANTMLRDLRASSEAAAAEWNKEREKLADANRAGKRSLDEAEAELAVRETEVRRLKVRCDDANAALDRARAQAAETQSRLQADVASLSAAKDRERGELVERLDKLQHAFQESQQRLGQVRSDHEHLLQRSRLELKNAQQSGHKALTETKEEAQRLRARVDELSARLRDELAHHEDVDTQMVEEQKATHALQSRCADAERRAADAAAQLALVLSQQEDRLRELKNMRTDLDRARLAEARSARRCTTLERRTAELKEQLDNAVATPLALTNTGVNPYLEFPVGGGTKVPAATAEH